jgi:hypothetical protein
LRHHRVEVGAAPCRLQGAHLRCDLQRIALACVELAHLGQGLLAGRSRDARIAAGPALRQGGHEPVQRRHIGRTQALVLCKFDIGVGVAQYAVDGDGQGNQEGRTDDRELGRKTDDLHQPHARPDEVIHNSFHRVISNGRPGPAHHLSLAHCDAPPSQDGGE